MCKSNISFIKKYLDFPENENLITFFGLTMMPYKIVNWTDLLDRIFDIYDTFI